MRNLRTITDKIMTLSLGYIKKIELVFSHSEENI